jgi:Ca2+/Na+ antiporter
MAELFAKPHALVLLVVMGSAAGLLISVLATARALVREEDPSPGRRALAHFIPIGICAISAAWLGRSDIAMGLVFGASVASMSAVAGFVLLAGPVDFAPPRAIRIWAYLPLPATLAFVLGFRGNVGLFEAAILAIQGILAALIWFDQREGRRWAPEDSPMPANEPFGIGILFLMQIIFAVALAIVSSIATTRGLARLGELDHRYPPGVMAGTLLAAVLALPMVSSGAPTAALGRAWGPITASAGVVLLNLCLLLPLVILIWGASEMRNQASVAATRPIFPAILYPRTAWRIDAPALLLLSMLLVPVSMGKFRLDRRLGAWLIIGYCGYLLASLYLSGKR